MLKRVFKGFLKLVLGLIVVSIIAYYSFLGWEYMTGGKYVDYINANKETVGLEGSFSYQIMENDLEKSKLILVGEIHGFKEPAKFDIHFFKHLHHSFGVRHYLAEVDFVQAGLLNTYLETGGDSLLQIALKNWAVVQGRNNKDYFGKYRAFHEFYQELPTDDKFHFIGIDKTQDWRLVVDYVNQLSTVNESLAPIIFDQKKVLVQLKNRINQLIGMDSLNEETRFYLAHLQKNIEYKEEKINREKVMFQNFQDLYLHYDLSDKRVYGYFGLYHTFQYRINGKHPFASQVRRSDLGLADNILSMNFLFVDSYMVTNSSTLPEFMRDEGQYTKMEISADNVWFMYLYGIQDFKRMTGENQKSLIKMNGTNNPYSNGSRMGTTVQLLPVTDVFEMTDKGKPYTQYSIFVRNSDWAEPMEN